MPETFQRRRSISKWEVARRYQSVESFLRLPLGEGLHTIEHKGRLIDLLIRDRGSDTTLIVFHGALSPRQRTIPYLQGESISEMSGMNLIACSDISLDRGPIACAWFLGDREIGEFRKILSPILADTLEKMGSKNTVLFGGSGGGYSAINFAQDFPGSTVLAMNPRLNLESSPKSTLSDYLKVCHGVDTKTPMQRVKSEFLQANLAQQVNQRQDFDLLIIQNSNDSRFLDLQVKPFLDELTSLKRTWIQLFDGDPGHIPVPRGELGRILSEIVGVLRADVRDFTTIGFTNGEERRTLGL